MGEGKQQKRPDARRSAKGCGAAVPLDAQGLLERIATLESRVSQLERALAPEPASEPAAPPAKPAKAKARCPGCHLPVQGASRGRCPWCGFLFQAVALAARPRRKLG